MACSKFRWGQRISRGNFSRIFGVRSNPINKPANFDGSIFSKTSRPAEERRGTRFCFAVVSGFGPFAHPSPPPPPQGFSPEKKRPGERGRNPTLPPTYVDIYG